MTYAIETDNPGDIRDALLVYVREAIKRESNAISRVTTQKAARFSEGARYAYQDVERMLSGLKIITPPDSGSAG